MAIFMIETCAIITEVGLYGPTNSEFGLATHICNGLRPEIVTNIPEVYLSLMKKILHQNPEECPNVVELCEMLDTSIDNNTQSDKIQYTKPSMQLIQEHTSTIHNDSSNMIKNVDFIFTIDHWITIIFFGSILPEHGNERTGTILWYRILLAQWAASRTDIFPQEMCSHLSKLHSSVDAHPFSNTKRIVEKAFNKLFHEIFSEFDEIPIGIGAIAQ
ncbi:3111_t:CDS:2, partial [Dentiscutata erythropus]